MTYRSNKGFTIWFTGLPCSGKSTLAGLVAPQLEHRGHGVEVLDGDVVRTHLCKGLGFSRDDRDENVRRIGFVAKLLSRHGATVITAAISPYRSIRDEIRASIENFVEVYVKTPLEVCILRDVKGMYKKAIAGEIKHFTGVDDPYESPLHPELVIETDKETPVESAMRILSKLEAMGLIERSSDLVYSSDEENSIRARLVTLGYLEA